MGAALFSAELVGGDRDMGQVRGCARAAGLDGAAGLVAHRKTSARRGDFVGLGGVAAGTASAAARPGPGRSARALSAGAGAGAAVRVDGRRRTGRRETLECSGRTDPVSTRRAASQ